MNEPMPTSGVRGTPVPVNWIDPETSGSTLAASAVCDMTIERMSGMSPRAPSNSRPMNPVAPLQTHDRKPE